jgi:hypothetical protein
MNQDNRQKFLLGAFRNEDYELEHVLNSSLQDMNLSFAMLAQ